MKVQDLSSQIRRLDVNRADKPEDGQKRQEALQTDTVHGDKLDLSPILLAASEALSGENSLSGRLSELTLERKAEISGRIRSGYYATQRATDGTADAITDFYS